MKRALVEPGSGTGVSPVRIETRGRNARATTAASVRPDAPVDGTNERPILDVEVLHEPEYGQLCPREPQLSHPRKSVSALRVLGGLNSVVLAIALLTLLAGGRAWGQASFTLSVSDSPDPITANQTLNYVINVTNVTGLFLTDVFVTNRFSGPVQVVGTTNSRAANVFITTNTVTFLITQFPGAGEWTTLSIGVKPTAFGSLTNTITVKSFNLSTTNAVTNAVTQVHAGQPDLAIGINGLTQPVLVNDWMTYTLAAGNVGGNFALGVVVTNHLPADTKIISIIPSNAVLTVTSNVLRWNVGRMGIGDSTNLTLTVQPTNVGLATVFASITPTNAPDTNTVNNTASNNILVGPLISGWVVSSNVSAIAFNPQTGLMEQMVRLVNVSGTSAPSARIIVTGLTNWLYSAVGTNDGNPFVVHGTTLAAGESVDLRLEYFVPTRVPVVIDDSQLQPFVQAAFNLTPPAGTPLPAPPPTLLLWSGGSVFLEFPATPGQTYAVLYRDNSIDAVEVMAQPPMVASGNRVQWFDTGPPKTVSLPAKIGARFYRVIQVP